VVTTVPIIISAIFFTMCRYLSHRPGSYNIASCFDYSSTEWVSLLKPPQFGAPRQSHLLFKLSDEVISLLLKHCWIRATHSRMVLSLQNHKLSFFGAPMITKDCIAGFKNIAINFGFGLVSRVDASKYFKFSCSLTCVLCVHVKECGYKSSLPHLLYMNYYRNGLTLQYNKLYWWTTNPTSLDGGKKHR
jgi:hypothetical protein